MKEKLRIIFLGTADFAVPSLETLMVNGYDVAAVITAPDKPSGRGLKPTFSPVKTVALEHNLKILQPVNLKDPEFIADLKKLNANLQIVVAFRMLPEVVWNMPELGTFNLHASLLPKYRGAAPINWAIINGEKESGLTTFFLKHEIDTGNIIFQEKETIHEDDDAGTLYERLMNKGAGLVLKTVQAIENNEVVTMPQPIVHDTPHAPKIFRETCEIDWNKPTKAVYNFIRGLSPYPAAWKTIAGKNFKIYKASISDYKTADETLGTIKTNNIDYLYIRCSDDFISIDELQVEGKKRMKIGDFLKGNKLIS